VAFCGDTAVGDRVDAQHFDQERFALACEAAFLRLDRAEDADDLVRRAFHLARTESRPVVLGVPQDVQQEPFPGPESYAGTPPGQGLAEPDPALIAAAADLVEASERPVLLLGRGALRADAGAAAVRLAERAGALVATTLHAKNWLNGSPFHLGIAGGYGTRAARELLREADCLIVAGASVSPYTSDRGALFEQARIVQFDAAPSVVLGDGRVVDCYVQGDARLCLELLEPLLSPRTGFRTPAVAERLTGAFEDPEEFELEPGTVDPREACRALDEELPEHVGLVLGSGQQIRFPTMLLQRQRPFLIAQHHFGCIGQGLTTAIGAAMATGTPTFTVEGDAGFMMHLAEFETAVRYGVPVLVVVMNDEALGAELHKSVAVGLDPALTRISTPDLGAVGVALGGRGALVRSIDELRAAVSDFVAEPGPMLLDVRISTTVLSIPYRRMYYAADV
jgi:thiamine pyrophosphate-dependent acetolactate synthase large subunit-like protein